MNLEIFAKWTLQNEDKFAHVKNYIYFCNMNEELKKYLKSETRKNEQEMRINEFSLKLAKYVLIIALVIGVVGFILAYLFTEVL